MNFEIAVISCGFNLHKNIIYFSINKQKDYFKLSIIRKAPRLVFKNESQSFFGLFFYSSNIYHRLVPLD